MKLPMPLLPREHGAYGQIAFPLIAAFAVSGASIAGVGLALALCAIFLAHEPGLVLLGVRGPRARRELSVRAAWWLAGWLLLAIVAGLATVLASDAGHRWSIAVPLLPGAVLVVAAVNGREKSWYGEIAAALAFSGAAVPISLAGGAPLATAAAVAIPFAALFVLTTLAVRIVILRVRRGGDPRETSTTRSATLLLAVGSGAGLGLAATLGLVPPSVPVAAAPGLLTAAAIAFRPPPAAQLRKLGWTLVAISVLTTAIVVSTTT